MAVKQPEPEVVDMSTREALMELSEELEPIWESAAGLRVRFRTEGWSDEYIETVVAAYVGNLLAAISDMMREG